MKPAAAHIILIKVYARTSTQTDAALLSNCRPPTARVHGGQARARRAMRWRKQGPPLRPEPTFGAVAGRGVGLGIGKLPAGLTFGMTDFTVSRRSSDGRARRHPRRSESKLLCLSSSNKVYLQLSFDWLAFTASLLLFPRKCRTCWLLIRLQGSPLAGAQRGSSTRML